MNIAKASIVFNWPYTKKLDILEEYSSSTKTAYYKKHISNTQVQKAIDNEIKKLRFSRDLPRYERETPKPKTIKREITGGPHKNAVRDPEEGFSLPGSIAIKYDASENNLYPPAISKAIQEREKLYNQREKIGQELIDFHGTMLEPARAANVARQKALLKAVQNYTHFINKWKESGELDFSIIQQRPELDEEERKILLERWRELGRKATRILDNIKKAKKSNDKERVEMWEAKRNKFKQEQDKIGLIIDVKRRKPYETINKRKGEGNASKAIED